MTNASAYHDMVYSDLELLVRSDMEKNGYDPDNDFDIVEYWTHYFGDIYE